MGFFENYIKINKYSINKNLFRALILGNGDGATEKMLQHFKPNGPYTQTLEQKIIKLICIQLFASFATVNAYSAIDKIFNSQSHPAKQEKIRISRTRKILIKM